MESWHAGTATVDAPEAMAGGTTLRVVMGSADAIPLTPEPVVLARVAAALDAALAEPDLSIGWRVAFRTARSHLGEVLEVEPSVAGPLPG